MSAREQCSDAEIAYCENYIISLCKSTAAIAMGSESVTPWIVGYQVHQRPQVKAYIDELLEQNTSTAKETLKLISDTQKGNLAKYMVPVKKWHTPQVKKGLAQLIEETKLYIQAEEDYCDAKGFTEEKYDEFQEGLELYRDRILRYQIELNYNPDAYRIVDGEAEEIETQELDLNLIVADKERGIIKSFKHTPQGIQVELCDPDTSKEKMAKIHGLYKEDNKQKTTNITILNNDPLNDTTNNGTTEDICS